MTTVGSDGAVQTLALPLTRQEMQALRARRSELSNQLTSAAGRRRDLSGEIRSAPDGASRAGLEARIGVLDKRIVQLESDIAETGRQLTGASAGLLAASEDSPIPGDIPDNVATVIGVFTFFVLFPIAIAFARNIWRRAGKSPPPAQLPPESAQRLERLEQGVEAIAIEIERVSEGQRFVTRLLSEGQPALGSSHRVAQPVSSVSDDR